MIRENINTNIIHRSYIQASREVNIEVNTEKTKSMVMSRHQNFLTANKSFENAAKFKGL
jgi:hypothetical protein